MILIIVHLNIKKIIKINFIIMLIKNKIKLLKIIKVQKTFNRKTLNKVNNCIKIQKNCNKIMIVVFNHK